MFQLIIQLLKDADEHLFIVINSFHCDIGDYLMWWISDRWIWIPLYLILAVGIFRHHSVVNAILCVVAIGIAVAIADQLCAGVIRPAVERLRPSCPDNPLSIIEHTVNGYHGGRFGFPSCHAANSFALATFLSLLYKTRKARCLIVAWALMLCWSRIYLGVHYPGDIVAGIAVGAMCGGFMFALWQSAIRHLNIRWIAKIRSNRIL